MFQLRFTTLVEAPLTVAFDVARTLGRPWRSPLREVVSVRPERDVYAGRGRPGVGDALAAVLRHRRRHAGRRAGRLGDRAARCARRAGRPGGAAAAGPPRDAGAPGRLRGGRGARGARRGAGGRRGGGRRTQGPGRAALGRALRRAAGSSPAARSSRGSPTCRPWCANAGRSSGVDVLPQAFLGEVPLDGSVAGGPLRHLDAARVVGDAGRRRAAGARARGAALGGSRRAGRPRLDRRGPPTPAGRPTLLARL